jgi:hypothetical protein
MEIKYLQDRLRYILMPSCFFACFIHLFFFLGGLYMEFFLFCFLFHIIDIYPLGTKNAESIDLSVYLLIYLFIKYHIILVRTYNNGAVDTQLMFDRIQTKQPHAMSIFKRKSKRRALSA